IESISCIPVSVAFAFNRHHSLTIPLLTKVKDYPLTDMSRAEIIECWKFIQQILLEKKLIGQNFSYDEYKLRLFGFRVGKLLSDTYIKTCTIFPELTDKSLEVLTSLWTRELKKQYEAMALEVHSRQFTRLGEEFNVKSYPDMFRLLYKILKFPLRKHQPTSEDSIVALLGQCKGKDGKGKKEVLLDILEER